VVDVLADCAPRSYLKRVESASKRLQMGLKANIQHGELAIELKRITDGVTI
jgi:hypothetical protein